MNREEIVKKINDIYFRCKVKGWDNHDAAPITIETYNHAIRFINKCEKNNISLNNCSISPLEDDNLSFKWSYKDNSYFSIDFDREQDRLLWCCYKDDKHYWSGNSIHFEDVLPNLKKYIDIHESVKK